MCHADRVAQALFCVCCVTAAVLTSGCAAVVEEGVRALVGDDGPRATASPPDRSERGATTSAYQHGATHDWMRAPGRYAVTPGRSLFERMSPPSGVTCKAVPVGLAQVFSGPTGPAASPLVSLGPLNFGIAGPDGAMADALATDRDVLKARALTSGARMAGEGPMCGNRIFFFFAIGGTPEEISVLR